MKKIIAMIIVVITILGVISGCAKNNAITDEDIVSRYCEIEGKTLITYRGIENDSLMGGEVYRYIAVDNETGHELYCSSSADHVQHVVRNDLEIN